MATIIEFPLDTARRARSVARGAPPLPLSPMSQQGMGTVLILPVVRIERQINDTTDDRGPREGAAPTRRRRRR